MPSKRDEREERTSTSDVAQQDSNEHRSKDADASGQENKEDKKSDRDGKNKDKNKKESGEKEKNKSGGKNDKDEKKKKDKHPERKERSVEDKDTSSKAKDGSNGSKDTSDNRSSNNDRPSSATNATAHTQPDESNMDRTQPTTDPNPPSDRQPPSTVSHNSVSHRQTWSNGLQFILTCTSYAVGLGNIWRFPAVVYRNGGGAFLIPYFFCSMIIGFPVLYLELCLGQFARAGPAVVYGRMKPAFQGIGWAMVIMSAFVSVFYNMVVAWSLLYLYIIASGQSEHMWKKCSNPFNTIYCISPFEDLQCATSLDDPTAFYFNQTCHHGNSSMLSEMSALFANTSEMSPAEEFFEGYILEKADHIGPMQMNWKLFGSYTTAWILTALALSKGTRIIGCLSYVTATAPYLIMFVLFGRALTLDGAHEGLKYYLLEPDLSVVWNPQAWRDAATQVCFSLSVGFGGILSFSSFNPSTQNVFRDALIVTTADATMSVIGGTAVFSILGFMSKQMNKTINEVVQDGTALAFVAYPEALIRMPVTPLWAFLFFTMVFLLGISSQFGYSEAPITAVVDQFPRLRKAKTRTVFAVSALLFGCGLVLCTRSGFFFFTILNEYSAGFALGVALLLECVLVSYIYGMKNFVADLRSMFGHPRHTLGRVFGKTGLYIRLIWMGMAPVMWITIAGFCLYDQTTSANLSVGKGNRQYSFPVWTVPVGWAISVIPLLAIPCMAIVNVVRLRLEQKSLLELFRVQPKWPSYKRMNKSGAPTSEESVGTKTE